MSAGYQRNLESNTVKILPTALSKVVVWNVTPCILSAVEGPLFSTWVTCSSQGMLRAGSEEARMLSVAVIQEEVAYCSFDRFGLCELLEQLQPQ